MVPICRFSYQTRVTARAHPALLYPACPYSKRTRHAIGKDPGAGLACQGSGDSLWPGDEDGFAPMLEVLDGCADFWLHTAFGEVSFVQVMLCFTERYLVQVLLVGLAVVERDFFYTCRDYQ